MKNSKSDGTQVQITAPAGGLTSGVLTLIEDTICVPLQDYSEGEAAIVFIGGAYEFEKDTDGNPYGGTGFAAEALEYAYFDEEAGLLVSDPTAILVGVYTEASAADDDTAVVRLTGFTLPE